MVKKDGVWWGKEGGKGNEPGAVDARNRARPQRSAPVSLPEEFSLITVRGI
jgi:hypothetical protein